MLEVEAKVRVPDLDSVRSRLKALGSRPCGRSVERDIYYNAPQRDFGVTDEALRVRYSQEACVVTYKGPKLPGYALKAREEVNIKVESGEGVELILKHLGFRPVREIVKTREVYPVAGATVLLDDVEGLGSFVEIEACPDIEEGPAVALVDRLAEELELPKEYISLSYLEMVLAKDQVSPDPG